MKTFLTDQKTRDRLNSPYCGTKDCNAIPTHAVFIVENLDQVNLMGVACEEHKDGLGDAFRELGVCCRVMTEPLYQFKERIANL
jgi:hypothetical protein